MTLSLTRPPSGDPPAGAAREAAVPGVSPQVYSCKDFAAIAAMVHSETGIVLGERKRMLAYSRIVPLMRAGGQKSFAEFLDVARGDDALKRQVLDALTTNHTYFNREPHHFEHFAETLRGGLIERAQSGATIRLWSAGCSSGEEIWTLLLTLLGPDRSTGRAIGKLNIVALASDISDGALESAKAATYPGDALRDLDGRLIANWCEKQADGRIAIGPEARRMVRFRRLNLLGEWPFSSRFDIIFCRNVMIYFDQETKERLVERLAGQLASGGHLYIGHSERVSGNGSALLEQAGPTIYRRRAP
ncbi:CheR family methyltransferase [Erythrobacter sp.]|jgi:chemotaxis protein methyltransferase CheR|uniref:CheR family methyltransferase n=1 Tax=Erythrobacter sp. TaxID=1042 RepID=UPI002EBD5E57|nr:protein-glutamate O-methyltransferase CheR [Erythrobacter sp.]